MQAMRLSKLSKVRLQLQVGSKQEVFTRQMKNISKQNA